MLAIFFILACSTTEDVEDQYKEGRLVVDDDGDGFLSDEDCDDGNDQVNPSVEEICDGIDNNCSGQVDEGVLEIFYADSDEDGYGNPNIETQSCEVPDGYVSSNSDCDDTLTTVYLNAEEICDGFDNDCDEEIDENVGIEFFADNDGDGFGNDMEIVLGCEPDFGRVQAGGDCDDSDPFITPLAAEICDGMDNDCDEEIDEDTQQTFYRDFDEDSFGDPNESIESCEVVEGYVDNDRDCDDLESFVHPLMVEICDEFDNDCDGVTDENDAIDVIEYYTDSDGDGIGAIEDPQIGCFAPNNTVLITGDCDDSNDLVHPFMVELCDQIDNDCNGNIDDEDTPVDAQIWFWDADQDGEGTAEQTLTACINPEGYVGNSDDCDDTNDLYNSTTLWYVDQDEDGFGGEASIVQCLQPLGYVGNGSDCDDNDEYIFLGADEICDGIDNDCDALVDQEDSSFDESTLFTFYHDNDGDGFGDEDTITMACELPEGTSEISGDCDDEDVDVSPDAEEIAYDGIDNDCSSETSDEQTDLMLYMDGTGDEFFDSSPHNWSVTPSGGVQQDNSFFKHGEGSGYFDGSDDRLEVEDVDWSFGYDDFTIDMWVWINGHADMGLASIENPITNGDGWLFDLDLTGNSGAHGLRFKAGTTDVVKGSGGSGGSYPTQTWTHVAAVRSNGVFTLYLNGQSVATATSEVFIEDTPQPLRIGQRGTTGDWFQGYLDDVRIIKGHALWTENFTPPIQSVEPIEITEPVESLFSESLFATSHQCMITSDNSIVCWGGDPSQNYSDVIYDIPTSGSYIQMSSGNYHVCAIDDVGSIICWGDDDLFPVLDAPTGNHYTQTSSGSYHSCAINSNGGVSCWGRDDGGQVSNAPTTGTYTQLTSGSLNTCGLMDDGSITCWGRDDFGMVSGAPSNSGYTNIKAGSNHVCAIHFDEAITCWGWNNFGQTSAPSGSFSQLASGWYYSCGLRTDGSVSCWGNDDYGEISEVPTGGTYTQITSGFYHVCALSEDGSVTCWGEDNYSANPPTFGILTSIQASSYNTCGVQENGNIVCWGEDTYGQSSPP